MRTICHPRDLPPSAPAATALPCAFNPTFNLSQSFPQPIIFSIDLRLNQSSSQSVLSSAIRASHWLRLSSPLPFIHPLPTASNLLLSMRASIASSSPRAARRSEQERGIGMLAPLHNPSMTPPGHPSYAKQPYGAHSMPDLHLQVRKYPPFNSPPLTSPPPASPQTPAQPSSEQLEHHSFLELPLCLHTLASCWRHGTTHSNTVAPESTETPLSQINYSFLSVLCARQSRHPSPIFLPCSFATLSPPLVVI